MTSNADSKPSGSQPRFHDTILDGPIVAPTDDEVRHVRKVVAGRAIAEGWDRGELVDVLDMLELR